VNFTVNDAAFEVEFTELLAHIEEEIAHEENVHLLDVFHLNSVNTVDLGDQTLRVSL